MHKQPKPRNIPLTLEQLNEKLDFESKRLVREKEDGIAQYINKTTVLNGISKLMFKKKDGEKVTLSYQTDKSGTLRFAREKQFTDASPVQEHIGLRFGRTSRDITS
jgi:hypothetical protein